MAGSVAHGKLYLNFEPHFCMQMKKPYSSQVAEMTIK